MTEGFSTAGDGKSLDEFDVAPLVQVVLGDDLEQCRRPVKQRMALYIGGMGPRERNFYNMYTRRMGYADEAELIQDLYLSGKKDEAVEAVPDRLVDECALVGPAERIRERLEVWKQAGRSKHVAGPRPPSPETVCRSPCG